MNRRVAIVEDDTEIRELVAEFLESEGYTAMPAANGRQALELLSRAAALPGVILLDVMMPHMNGDDFRSAQRADPRLSPIPIVVMSAGADLAVKAKTLEAAGVLKKPFVDLETILATVSRFF